MKYIRTKDGIFEVTHEREKWFTVKLSGTGGVDIHKEMVKKQANTIEELCDEFVVYLPKFAGIPYVVFSDSGHGTLFEEAKDQYDDYTAHNEEVYLYGAIWTDKGLIYVAKMNEKGELELL